MQFEHMVHSITIHANVVNGPLPSSPKQLRCMIQTNSTSTLFHLSVHSNPQPNPPEPPQPIPAIQVIISQFTPIFLKPTTLPPPRQITHHINLLPSTKPLNVFPHRYPYFQKSEIEKQVSNLLDSGLIRVSQSPLSSPVLLVKKKDGYWRMRGLSRFKRRDCSSLFSHANDR